MAKAQQATPCVGCNVTVDPSFYAQEFALPYTYIHGSGGLLKPGEVGVVAEVATVGGTSTPLARPFRVEHNAISWWCESTRMNLAATTEFPTRCAGIPMARS